MKGDIIVYTNIDEVEGKEEVAHSMTVVGTDNKIFDEICVSGKGGIECTSPYEVTNKNAWTSNKVGGVGYYVFRKVEPDKQVLSEEEIEMRKKTTSDFKSAIRTITENLH